MSVKNNMYGGISANSKRESETVPFPRNCNKPCPYGRAREFCWPCYAKLMKEKG